MVLLFVKQLFHVPVLGHLPWGCIDLLSASGNYKKRYGLVYADFEHDLYRYKNDSFYWYKKVIA
ncbi:family 1 glycosylhydrolase [Lactobacillus colini]|uniref:family 1 glycosylhydrolase n=1 Tax=Lactobacillus colini TaxID=1819254 RepID=UPI001AE7C716